MSHVICCRTGLCRTSGPVWGSSYICLLLFYTVGGMDTGLGSVPNPTAIASVPLIPGSAPSTTMVDVIPPVPSITTLLATPLPPTSGSQPTPAASPLILSSALPPIPGKLVERIQSGTYIDFKEFLSDNVMLLQRLRELGQGGAVPAGVQPLVDGSRLREISDPLSWASCFLAFMAARVDHQETSELAAYGSIALQLARKHAGGGWLAYDRQFRQHQAAGANLSWTDISPSLMAATVLCQMAEGGSRTCSLCLAADHTREDCALASLELPKSQPTVSRQSAPPRQYRRSAPYGHHDLCHRFNRGWCNSNPCRFQHVCSNCFKPGHPEHSCPDARGKQKGGRPPSAHPSSPQHPSTPGGKSC